VFHSSGQDREPARGSMKLLFITTKGDWGGSEPLWCEAAERALGDGHKVTVVLPQVDKLARQIEGLAEKGAEIVMRPPAFKRTLFRRICWRLLGICEPETRWWSSRFALVFDSICVSQGGAYCVMNIPGLANWLLEIDTPFVLVGHSHRAYALPTGELREAIRKLFEKAEKVCLVAEDHVRAVSRFLGIALPNALVVQNPVNLKEEKAEIGNLPATSYPPPVTAPEELLLDSGRLTLDTGHSPLVTAPQALMACVARFEIRDKGQDLLLEALSEPVWQERNFQLDFYGSGPDREILENLIRFYGLEEKVRIVGFESDIRKIWAEHGLLVLPSLSEGTPISLIEAQLCARAALVTRVDGNTEWVEEGETGFLAEAPTVYHLRLALERAWENRHRLAEMGEAALAACLAKRDPDPSGTLLLLMRESAIRTQSIK